MTPPTPYLVQSLFGDIPLERLEVENPESEPWRSFARARAEFHRGDKPSALSTLTALANREGIQARYRIEAWHLIRELGGKPQPSSERDVLGVVVEVAMEGGQDLLAVYADRTAHYYNYSGAGVIWMRPNSSLDKSADAVLSAAKRIVRDVDPWMQLRRPPPSNGNARLNILTPMGVHFGEGRLGALSRDRAAGPIMRASTTLLAKMTSLPRVASSSPNS